MATIDDIKKEIELDEAEGKVPYKTLLKLADLVADLIASREETKLPLPPTSLEKHVGRVHMAPKG